ncbi:MAG: carbohydrate ABC transporter permease [Chloroflexota bacterium]|nr:carbohydrate ABC transporter permease [Chloroflexota bacterium]
MAREAGAAGRTGQFVGAPEIPAVRVAAEPQRRRVTRRVSPRALLVTSFSVMLLAAFLSPLLRTVTMALKSQDQISEIGAPLWPADPAEFEYEGRDYAIYQVPIDGGIRDLALVKKGRQESQFVDPANPDAGLITWQGSWRALDRSWEFSPKFGNFADVWEIIDFPRLLRNTVALAIIGGIGTVVSCTLVAYGFARFRFPGRGLLFMLLISTIFLPAAVTLIPTYTIFVRLGWVGTWLPILVPAFFANAYDVFLLRQYFLTIPRELDDAAKIDGAGPLRILTSVIVPQAWPVIVAVAIFHLVYSWNLYFEPLIYLSTEPELQPIALGLSKFSGIYGSEPQYIQAATLMTLVIPMVIFFFAQRAFMRGIVITGVEK